MLFYKLLSVLLEYPNADTYAHLDELATASDELGLKPDERAVLRQFVAWCGEQSLIDLQARYVETFDLTPDHSLHLTHHLFEEEDRERGITLATLREFFVCSGFELSSNELPDYLPLILEFVSESDDLAKAKVLLDQGQPAVVELFNRLTASQSPLAPLLGLLQENRLPDAHVAPAIA